jgi:hypothetical protein
LFHVVGAAFDFLQAKNIGIFFIQELQEILPQDRTQAVDIPGNQFHAEIEIQQVIASNGR